MAKSKTEKCMKKLNRCDVGCLKAATAAFVLFLITAWPALHDLLMKVHWGWYLAATVILSWKPFMKYVKA
ncbi:hypothetical protein GF378_02185 [Candidatus Pacearchaeota archaeon]|nr:hypothetical protein [Candidatus Pacearchaeota archaeon]